MGALHPSTFQTPLLEITTVLFQIDMLLQTQSTTTTSRASVTTKPVVFGTTSPLKTLEDTVSTAYITLIALEFMYDLLY